MATGVHPFHGESAGIVFKSILDREPVSPVRLNPGVPPDLERIITKALEKDRNLRYQSAAEIRTDLQRLKRDSESGRATVAATETGLTPVLKSTWFQWVVVTGATVLVIGLAVGGWLFHSRKGHALTDKDTIVLSDFDNKTGDEVFDDTLKQGLSVQLEQSPFLNLLSDRKVNETLKLMCPVYLRAESYLMLQDGKAAAAEFQKFIAHRGLVMNFPWGALARLGLARAYALQGDTAKAKAAYQDFLTLWKDADPDIPIFIAAKAEYAKLQ